MMRHPKATEHIRWNIERIINDLHPPADDPAELAATAAEIEISVETLMSWRDDYKSWDTVEEWREQIVDSLTADVIRAANTPGPRNWRRWKLTRWMATQAYVTGISCGGGVQYDWSGNIATKTIFTGTKRKWDGKRHRPSYVLWWPVRKWRCLLVHHHWPSNELIAFNLCRKCLPCPECHQAAPLEHDCVPT